MQLRDCIKLLRLHQFNAEKMRCVCVWGGSPKCNVNARMMYVEMLCLFTDGCSFGRERGRQSARVGTAPHECHTENWVWVVLQAEVSCSLFL